MDLFTHAMNDRMRSEAPLAARKRPRTLDEYAGQQEILGPGKLIRRAIEADRPFSSIILWGPPGSGKTTLAMSIGNETRSHKDVREFLNWANARVSAAWGALRLRLGD